MWLLWQVMTRIADSIRNGLYDGLLLEKIIVPVYEEKGRAHMVQVLKTGYGCSTNMEGDCGLMARQPWFNDWILEEGKTKVIFKATYGWMENGKRDV